MDRLPRDERELMDHARMYHEVSGISREAVDAAFPGMLAAPPPAGRPGPQHRVRAERVHWRCDSYPGARRAAGTARAHRLRAGL